MKYSLFMTTKAPLNYRPCAHASWNQFFRLMSNSNRAPTQVMQVQVPQVCMPRAQTTPLPTGRFLCAEVMTPLCSECMAQPWSQEDREPGMESAARCAWRSSGRGNSAPQGRTVFYQARLVGLVGLACLEGWGLSDEPTLLLRAY
jgi:hypothetical protein